MADAPKKASNKFSSWFNKQDTPVQILTLVGIGVAASKVEAKTRNKMGFKMVHNVLDSAIDAVVGIIPEAK